jgi:polar amino acid transport system substrate-binding protein
VKFLFVFILNYIIVFGGEFRIITEDLPPYNYKAGKELKGISVDIVNIILDELGYKNEIIEVYPWSRGLKILDSNDNAILFSTVYSKQRAKKYKFACPLVPSEVYFYKNKNNQIKIETLKDLRKVKKIGVVKDFFNHQKLESLGFTNLDISSYYKTAILKLTKGKVDLIVGSKMDLYFNKPQHIDISELENTGLLFNKSNLCIAFNKNFPDEEIEKWREILRKIHDSGKYKKIFNKYLEYGKNYEY